MLFVDNLLFVYCDATTIAIAFYYICGVFDASVLNAVRYATFGTPLCTWADTITKATSV